MVNRLNVTIDVMNDEVYKEDHHTYSFAGMGIVVPLEELRKMETNTQYEICYHIDFHGTTMMIHNRTTSFALLHDSTAISLGLLGGLFLPFVVNEVDDISEEVCKALGVPLEIIGRELTPTQEAIGYMVYEILVLDPSLDRQRHALLKQFYDAMVEVSTVTRDDVTWGVSLSTEHFLHYQILSRRNLASFVSATELPHITALGHVVFKLLKEIYDKG